MQKMLHTNGYPMGFINRIANAFVDNVVNGTSAFDPYSLGVVQPNIL